MNLLRVDRLSIGPRLALSFAVITALMVVGTALFLWQFHLLRIQADELTGVSRELATVMHLQNSLLTIDAKLNDLVRSDDLNQLAKEADLLRVSLVQETERARNELLHLPRNTYIEPTFLPTLAVIENTLPSQLEAIKDLATAGDWEAVRLRITNEKKPLQAQASALVNSLDREVRERMNEASQNIASLQRQMLLAVSATIVLILSLATLFGWAITRSITNPLGRLVEGSRALARGDFQHHVTVSGRDELAVLSAVFNDTADTLDRLYDSLRSQKEKLREGQNELRQLIELVPAHVLVLAPDGSGLTANQRVLDYHGITFEQWKSDRESLRRALVHRDDLERHAQELRAGLSAQQPFGIEARLRRKDGEYRWFLSRFAPLRDDRGSVLRWYAARTDIEEEKQESERARHENLALREEVNRSGVLDEVLGSSEKLVQVLSVVGKVAPTSSTVLILGETGTGKELIAHAIHRQSTRAHRPFIRVNCAAMPTSLISSELFGHERGAFTGAQQRRLGRFEAANGGTIFLDEIGELPAETQVSLLRVLQERQFERVGSNQSISVDVRILAATNRDLKAAVAAGTFRQDLFYRLNVFPITLPPLRERKEDIPLLVEYFVARLSKRAGKNFRQIRKSTLDLFESYSWPGNIRELQNIVERAVLVCEGDTLHVEEAWLRPLPSSPPVSPLQASAVELPGLGRLEADQERELIEAALQACAGRISGPSGAAAKLGIPRQTLESKIARLGIKKSKFQAIGPMGSGPR